MLERFLARRLPLASPPRRIPVLTGARQVGKTTLAKALYADSLRYVNLDSPGERQRLGKVPAEGWGVSVGAAVLDEVQKAPHLLEKLKWAFDQGEIDFSVLLGSSRILLLDKVKESLAGRVFLFELWPLTVGELVPHFGGPLPSPPFATRILAEGADLKAEIDTLASRTATSAAGRADAAVTHVLAWGGMPPLLELGDEDRWQWLDSYQATYLERDLGDLARLRDLQAFTTCHRLAALRAGCLLQYSDLARDAGVPATTTKSYLRYLELSYQTIRLPAWSANLGVRLVKAPKLIWCDSGIQRTLSGQTGGLSGAQYESTMVAQVLMTLWNHGMRFDHSHLRTSGGLEVDLVLEQQQGIVAIELKARSKVDARDARPIEKARRLFGDAYRGGLVVYRGPEVVRLTETVFAIPDWALLGV
jgi:predicted AAA+ superfamily ATPase